MAVFLVTWDLNKAKPNYDDARNKLIAHLTRYPHIKDEGLDSVWFIQSSAQSSDIVADIRTRLDGNDRLFVTSITTHSSNGWLNQKTWDWVQARW